MKRAWILAAAVLTATTFSRASGADTASDAEAAIEAGSQRYAGFLRAMDGQGLADLYDEAGELRNPGMETLKGREAIRGFLASLKGARVESSTMTTEAIEVSGNLGVQWGTYVQRVAPPGQPAQDFRGRYVAQWERQVDGRWLVKRMMAQPGPPSGGERRE